MIELKYEIRVIKLGVATDFHNFLRHDECRFAKTKHLIISSRTLSCQTKRALYIKEVIFIIRLSEKRSKIDNEVI